MWHVLPDVGPGTFNLGDLATDNGYTQPLNFRALIAVVVSSASATTARIGEHGKTTSTQGIPITNVSATTIPTTLTLPWVGETSLNQLGAYDLYVPANCKVSIAWEY